MQSMTVPAGESIFAPGDPSSAVYIIEDGEIAIRVGEGAAETEVARLVAGELFGESGVLESRPRAARAVAIRPTVLLVTPREDFLHAFGLENDRALVILKLLCRRLRGSNQRLAQPDPAPGDTPAHVLRLFPADDRIAAAMPDEVDVTYLPFQVGNRFGGETLPIASNRSLCIPARGDPELSAPHFEIVRRGGHVSVRDLASRTGTIVNGIAIGRSSAEPFTTLRSGDNFITAGRATSPFKFRLRLGPGAPG
jgi:CRP-like cAMP-binding protein